jgi:hypothetical protein
MSSELTPLKPGEIRFHQASPPPLPPGDYTLKVIQTLHGAKADEYTSTRKDIDQTYDTEAAFTVSGPRFYLKPSEVYSVYPPAGQFGPFDNALPHIVFTRRTLPWERTIDGRPQDANAPVPWMALLLLTRDDFANKEIPKVTARTVAKLLSPEAGIQGPKGLTLERGQTDGDLCNTIDLPAVLFAEIAPTIEDLPFLAHVREVKTGGKETLSLKQDGWFTVVLGNRLPATNRPQVGEPKDGEQAKVDDKIKGETNLVCLVSLEGFGGLLPKVDAGGKETVSMDQGKTQLRLAVLASWNFTCHGNNDFKTKMNALDDTSLLTLKEHGDHEPDWDEASNPWTCRICNLQKTDSNDAAKNAFTLGYTGLNHTTRLGEKTVSWYRGPLVPLQMDPRSPYAFIPCADRALRYDFNSGLFAAEYAAAYELGRLMALQNRSFAGAMYRFRKRVSQDLAAEEQRANLERDLDVPEMFRGRFAEADSVTGYKRFDSHLSLEDAVAKLFAGINKAHLGRSGVPTDQPPTPTVLSEGVSFDPPAEVTRFLARAVLLYGIPFHYLVPDERMLPPESIRFFYLDPGWISTLIQGATSVGRLGEREAVLDISLRHRALDKALIDAAEVREKGAACEEPKTEKASWPLTGFLLRSELVDGWQGVEMRAYKELFTNEIEKEKDALELAPLRIDRLAPDVLLCIFNGKVMTLTVKQPPEGLHFGLSPQGNGKYQRLSLRKVTEASGVVQPGAQIANDEKLPIQVPMRQPADPSRPPTRVVCMAKLAELFKEALKALRDVTSSELGVELVESPGLVEFKAGTTS